MGISEIVEKIRTKQYNLTARERLLVIVATALLVMFAIYSTSPEDTVVSNIPIDMTNIPSKSVSPIGVQGSQVSEFDPAIRDPFSGQPLSKEQKSNEEFAVSNVNSNAPVSIPKPKAVSQPNESFKLTGIVGTADQRLAVIMSGNISKSYKLNEFVGTYKLSVINSESVILIKAGNNLVLNLEKASQKGGDNGVK